MTNLDNQNDDLVDAHVDHEIAECLCLDTPRSFFLFAGAGSGKTRSLTEALRPVLERERARLRIRHQQVGVITYTNAACEEIKRRLEFDPLVEVSTIHSFIWSQIGGLTTDIKGWLYKKLGEDITKLQAEESKGRPGTKASSDRQRKIESRTKRLERLKTIKKFTYNPDGDNIDRDALDHNEVIQIGSDFLTHKPLMQQILVSKFPILLIDESQDTHQPFMDALFTVQATHRKNFSLGLLGDTMQRIYGHGKPDLGQDLPDDWAKPVKEMNHRCPRRIIELINRIRSETDGQVQRGRSNKENGVVRLFIARADNPDYEKIECRIRAKMADIAMDKGWTDEDDAVKTLTLEHHMSARRLGFFEMFEALHGAPRLRTGLLDGTLPGLRLFGRLVLPLLKARKANNGFGVSAILRNHSPLLSKSLLKQAERDQVSRLQTAATAVEQLASLWTDDRNPSFLDVLKTVSETQLFPIPESLQIIATRDNDEHHAVEDTGNSQISDDEENTGELAAWDEFTLTPFSQIEPYQAYVSGEAAFDTHQGVKGLEFPRVMVILDDNEARGFLFKYEKLFGVSKPTATDIKNQREGKETSIDRTRRLLYVTCSRAEESLALVLYTTDPKKARQHVSASDWLQDDEIEIIH